MRQPAEHTLPEALAAFDFGGQVAGALRYGMDIFERVEEDLYEHSEEEHTEYAHDAVAVMEELRRLGFIDVQTRPDGPMAGPDRVFIQAKRGYD